MNNKRKEFQQRYSEFDTALPNSCQNCGSDEDLHIHHIVPLSLDGNNILSNMARLCMECHNKIHGQNLDYKNLKEKKFKDAVKEGRVGRPTSPEKDLDDAYQLWLTKKHTIKEILKQTGVSQGRLYRKINSEHGPVGTPKAKWRAVKINDRTRFVINKMLDSGLDPDAIAHFPKYSKEMVLTVLSETMSEEELLRYLK
ncbi:MULTISPECIES: HNH endonuclease [Gammaproteobacteria]|uniref:HNH endonuclease n=1 Tax=Acinetobacter sp. HRXRD-152 TaxID=3404808 RepID=UPI003BB77186